MISRSSLLPFPDSAGLSVLIVIFFVFFFSFFVLSSQVAISPLTYLCCSFRLA